MNEEKSLWLKHCFEFFKLSKQETLKRHSKAIPIQFNPLSKDYLIAIKLTSMFYCDVFLKHMVKHPPDSIQSGTDLV